jgi:16S rRNA A1518/A1519 N6-dimethyltransferase RsmA/KsgA/DIM1 with predicted DNA glycosylase/AP lyase activity
LIGLFLALVIFFIICVKVVAGIEPRNFSPPPVGKYESDVIKIPKEETISYQKWLDDFTSKGNKTEQEIDQMVEKQNDCLNKIRQLECE